MQYPMRDTAENGGFGVRILLTSTPAEVAWPPATQLVAARVVPVLAGADSDSAADCGHCGSTQPGGVARQAGRTSLRMPPTRERHSATPTALLGWGGACARGDGGAYRSASGPLRLVVNRDSPSHSRTCVGARQLLGRAGAKLKRMSRLCEVRIRVRDTLRKSVTDYESCGAGANFAW
jgi:hypothetical protein